MWSSRHIRRPDRMRKDVGKDAAGFTLLLCRPRIVAPHRHDTIAHGSVSYFLQFIIPVVTFSGFSGLYSYSAHASTHKEERQREPHRLSSLYPFLSDAVGEVSPTWPQTRFQILIDPCVDCSQRNRAPQTSAAGAYDAPQLYSTEGKFHSEWTDYPCHDSAHSGQFWWIFCAWFARWWITVVHANKPGRAKTGIGDVWRWRSDVVMQK